MTPDAPHTVPDTRITFIQTGGTIDKDYPRSQGGYPFEITTPAVDRILASLRPGFEYEVIPLLQKDSLDLTDADRELIFSACRDSPSDRIVITHGTDSILTTTEFLSTIPGKTIVLTGAMRPEWFRDSDAHANLGVAIGAAQTLGSGVYVVMHGRVHPWNEVARDPESGRFIGK
jgi:L-asparaginase